MNYGNPPDGFYLDMGVICPDERGIYGTPTYDPKVAEQQTSDPSIMRSGQVFVHTNSLPSNFTIITGSTGSGKSSLGRCLIDQWLQVGVPVVSFDLHGDLLVNPQQPVVKLGKNGTASFRPLLPAREIMNNQGLESYRELTIDAFFPRQLGGSQVQFYRRMFDAFMAKNGLTEETKDRSEINLDSFQVSKFCTFIQKQVAEAESADQKVADSVLKYLESLINPALEGDDFIQIADVIEHGARIDFSGLSERDKKLTVNLVLKLLLAEIMASDSKEIMPLPRVIIYIDEAKVVIDQRDPDNSTIASLMAEGRKFGVGAILATQQVSSFGGDICDNASVAIALACNSRAEASRIQRRLGFPKEGVLKKPMGHGCIRWGALEAHHVGFKTIPQNLALSETTLQARMKYIDQQ